MPFPGYTCCHSKYIQEMAQTKKIQAESLNNLARQVDASVHIHCHSPISSVSPIKRLLEVQL